MYYRADQKNITVGHNYYFVNGTVMDKWEIIAIRHWFQSGNAILSNKTLLKNYTNPK